MTSFTPSASIACNAVETFSRWWCWFAGLGFHRGKRLLVRTSTRAHRRVPSLKSSARSKTGPLPTSAACFRCSFTQFLNVFAWISTHKSSWPLIGMPFAAVPSADRATRPTSCSGRNCSVDCILIPSRRQSKSCSLLTLDVSIYVRHRVKFNTNLSLFN